MFSKRASFVHHKRKQRRPTFPRRVWKDYSLINRCLEIGRLDKLESGILRCDFLERDTYSPPRERPLYPSLRRNASEPPVAGDRIMVPDLDDEETDEEKAERARHPIFPRRVWKDNSVINCCTKMETLDKLESKVHRCVFLERDTYSPPPERPFHPGLRRNASEPPIGRLWLPAMPKYPQAFQPEALVVEEETDRKKEQQARMQQHEEHYLRNIEMDVLAAVHDGSIAYERDLLCNWRPLSEFSTPIMPEIPCYHSNTRKMYIDSERYLSPRPSSPSFTPLTPEEEARLKLEKLEYKLMMREDQNCNMDVVEELVVFCDRRDRLNVGNSGISTPSTPRMNSSEPITPPLRCPVTNTTH
uniref:PEHE domain-containing protein n=1 Tax=Steinernema glaseri TaxID=37863 RepID=A0A1I8ADU7_9BILA